MESDIHSTYRIIECSFSIHCIHVVQLILSWNANIKKNRARARFESHWNVYDSKAHKWHTNDKKGGVKYSIRHWILFAKVKWMNEEKKALINCDDEMRLCHLRSVCSRWLPRISYSYSIFGIYRNMKHSTQISNKKKLLQWQNILECFEFKEPTHFAGEHSLALYNWVSYAVSYRK